MLRIVVTGQIVRVEENTSSTKENFWGNIVLKETFWTAGAKFARTWRIWIPAYLSNSAKALIKQDKFIGVEASNAVPAPEDTNEFGHPITLVAQLNADRIFIL